MSAGEEHSRTPDTIGRLPDHALERWDFPGNRVTLHTVVDHRLVDELYAVYSAAFEPIRTRAAARHLLTLDEFAEEMADERLQKFLAWDEDDQVVGIAAMSRDLTAVPWISPDYYRNRYPEAAARNALYYFAYILVRPDLRDSRVFHRLTDVFTGKVADEQGVLCYDICSYNDTSLRFGERIESFVRRRHGGNFGQIDSQNYYAMRFDGEHS